MVGRWISHWNSPFLGDMLVFWVYVPCFLSMKCMLCFLYSVLMIVFRCPFFKLNGKLNLAIQAVAIRFAFGLDVYMSATLETSCWRSDDWPWGLCEPIAVGFGLRFCLRGWVQVMKIAKSGGHPWGCCCQASGELGYLWCSSAIRILFYPLGCLGFWTAGCANIDPTKNQPFMSGKHTIVPWIR